MEQNEIKSFLNKNINLDTEKYTQVVKKYKSSKEQLDKDGFTYIKRQGSMATKTAIKPKNPDHEYDLDVAVITSGDYKANKDKLQESLKKIYQNVERKNKCINVKWNNQFNGDFVIMKDLNNNQWIYDEKSKKEIQSNNLELIRDINAKFKESNNDEDRDCAKLLKFYLRQHEETDGLLPSIVQNLLVTSNSASKDLNYVEKICTTLNNIANYFYKKIKKSDILSSYWNYSSENYIKTKISTISEMENIVKVIQDLVLDISKLSLRSLPVESKIRSANIHSSTVEKHWKK